jgi:hypothetical protein
MGIEEVVRRLAQEQEKLPEVVAQQVPAKYQPFVCWLDQNKQLSQQRMAVTPELGALGVWSNERGTYISLRVPYMAVDGRMLWFADLHREAKAKYSISSNIAAICELLKVGSPPVHYPLVVWIDSELFGRLEGVSRIFWDAPGPHRTNPLETAYTSALGRAIAQAGIGLIGTGIASADEVEVAHAAQQAAETPTAPKADRPAPVKSALAAAAAPAKAAGPAAPPQPEAPAPPPAAGGEAPASVAQADQPAVGTELAFRVKGYKEHRRQDQDGREVVVFEVVLEHSSGGGTLRAYAKTPGAISQVVQAHQGKYLVRPLLVTTKGGVTELKGLDRVA